VSAPEGKTDVPRGHEHFRFCRNGPSIEMSVELLSRTAVIGGRSCRMIFG
jgi:hypothetical protein